MSEPYPSGPQQPGFQPSPNGQPYYPQGFDASQQGGAAMPPNPYGQQPTGYPPAGYGAVQPGYGQPTGAGYPPQPMYGQAAYAAAPVRPGSATGASVLGIVSGSLGIIAGFFALAIVSAVDTVTSSSFDGMLPLAYVQAAGTFITALGLFVSGITFLKGKGYGVLLVSAIAQAVLVTLGLVVNLTQNADSFNGMSIVVALIGYGLAGTTIFLLLSPEAKQWRK